MFMHFMKRAKRLINSKSTINAKREDAKILNKNLYISYFYIVFFFCK